MTANHYLGKMSFILSYLFTFIGDFEMTALLSLLSQHFEPLSLLKKTVKLLFALVAAVSLFGLFLIFTPKGNQIALTLISELTPYQVQFSSMKGNLYNHVLFEDLQIKGPELVVKSKRLEMRWDINQILNQNKTIQSLDATDLLVWYENKKIVLPKHYDDSTISQAQDEIKKSLPFALMIENISIHQAQIHWNNIDHTLSEFSIKKASSNLATVEEVHYQGAFGSFDAYLKDAIKINWDLNLAKNPYLLSLQSSAITTKGQILLPTKHIDDPQNQFEVSVQSKEFRQGKHHVENANLSIKGTLAKHQVNVTGLYNHAPVKSTITGQFSTHEWRGKLTTLKVNHERWQKIGNSTGDILINWQHPAISSSLALVLGEKYPVMVEVAIDKKQPYNLKGTTKAHFNQIKSLSTLIPSVSNLRGQLDIDLALSGTLLAPQWLGYVQLKDAKLPATSLGKKAILNDLHLSFLPDNKMTVTGKGLWGSGEFTIEGNGKLLASTPSFDIKLKGENLLLSDTPEYYIIANPDLNLTLFNGQVKLTGSIVIPEAEIKSLKSPDMASASDDVVVISKKQHKLPKPLVENGLSTHIATHIDLILKDKITYKGHGVSSKVGGRLEINQQPGQPPLAKGKLHLTQGTYKAYGKVFDINYGQILFTGGPIYDPIIDFRAQRTIEPQSTLASFKSNQAILAGVTFSGNLKSPKIGFYSNPSMPDNDIISYLIVGRPQSQINEAQAELLFQAVSQLANVMGGNRKDVQFNLAEKLKLDQLGFSKKQNYIPTPGSHNPLEDTVFVLGKQLSSKLYLNYSVGLVDSASQFGMRYSVGKNMTIEAATGTQGSSADVLLSFEGR